MNQENPYDGVTWTDARDLGIHGLAWADQARQHPFDRFPSALQEHISERLWQLSTWSAGVHIEFTTAATDLFARWSMIGENERDDKMADVGRSGLDSYGLDANGTWRWIGSRQAWTDPEADGRLHFNQLDGQKRTYRVYLPIMRRVAKLEIGARASLHASPARPENQKIAYYGTSIVHGAGAGRSGMPHPCQLSRLLSREVYNLGFCGRAYCEPIIADYLIQLDPALFIIDMLPNNSPAEILERLPPFIQQLRKGRPNTPILLVEDRKFGDASFLPHRETQRLEKNAAQFEVFQQLQASGLSNLHIAKSESWFGDDFEGTNDGSHPNDLGAWRMADQMLPIVKGLLAPNG